MKEGDLLVEIDDRDLLTEKESALTEIEGAKLSMEKAKKNFERARELFEAEAHQPRGLRQSHLGIRDRRKTAWSKRSASSNSSRTACGKRKSLAPTDGTVLTVPVIEGQVVIAAASVNSGTTLMTHRQSHEAAVEMHINQVDKAAARTRQGGADPRRVAQGRVDMDARISFIAPDRHDEEQRERLPGAGADRQARSAPPPRHDGELNIPIARVEDAVSVPITAVFKSEGNKKVVYVRHGDGTEKREVKIGVTNIDHAQILNGVKEGEEILLVEPARSARSKLVSCAPATMALIELREVTKRYRVGEQEIVALDGIDLDIAQGEYAAIIGPSGSGKSTLMHLLGCLDTPTTGTHDDRRHRRQPRGRQPARGDCATPKIGFVFQSFNLLPKFNVLQNVELPMIYCRRRGARSAQRRALVAIERVGLSNRVKNTPLQLSGGQMQRVAIARALVNRPADHFRRRADRQPRLQTGESILELFRN